MDPIAYVNGSFVPLADAKVSVLDRGFLFADGIYEVSAVLDGRLVDNTAHLARDGMVGRARIRANGGWFNSGWYPVGYALARDPSRWIWQKAWALWP